jgi:hypothetical protein
MIGTLEEYVTRAGWRFYTDRKIVESENYSEMRLRLERVHNAAHNYIGGSIGHFIQRPFCISHPFKCRDFLGGSITQSGPVFVRHLYFS